MTEDKDNILFTKKDEKPKVRSKVGQWFVDLWKKTLLFLNAQFTGIFEKGKIFFTLIFFVVTIVIALFSFGGYGASFGVKNAVNIISFSVVLGFLFLMICTFIPALSKHLFEEEGSFTKIIISVITFILSFIIVLIWALFGEEEVTIVFLRFSQLLPYFFILVFLGVNILQIHFLKDGISTIANKAEDRMIVQQIDTKKKNIAAIPFLILSLILPLLLHFFTVWIFWADANSPETIAADPEAPAKYIAWVVIIGILYLGMDVWQVYLFIRSKKYSSVNVYSSLLYMFISLIIWFRTYGFITSFLKEISTIGTIFVNALGNILLVILTAVFILRMIAKEVKETKKMNVNAIPFLVFALVLMYVAGQVVLILGSVTTTKQVDIVNNSILLVSSVVYYIWYSQYILQRMNYIKRTRYTIKEIKGVITEFAENLKETAPSESEKINSALETILIKHKIEEKDIS
ncbi:MAG: hypothetical protein EU530_01435 [Promethearchaeota archaeon]|nr:MAG: hypothetical protein EU530_01435 [Candidatus Lokiarchaeota archaeon]